MYSGFEEPEPEAIFRIRDCPTRFGPEDRNELHTLPNQMLAFIDSVGRPSYDYISLPMIFYPMKRDEECQGAVAKLGKSTDEGGHGVGARLGGWNRRANLTPQDGVLNKSYEWKQIDATVDTCAANGYSPEYVVAYHYEDDLLNRPQLYDVTLVVYVPGTCPPVKKGNDIAILNRNPTQDDRAAMSYFAEGFKKICKVPGKPCKPPAP